MPNSRSGSWATPPAATRAAVSRALARSRTSRASFAPYLSMPARSAWPGRTRVIRLRLTSSAAAGLSRRQTSDGLALALCGIDGHALAPVLPVSVRDLERNRRAERQTAAHAGDDVGLVVLDQLAPAAAVTTLSPCQVAGQVFL